MHWSVVLLFSSVRISEEQSDSRLLKTKWCLRKTELDFFGSVYIPPVSHVIDMPLFSLLRNANKAKFGVKQPQSADTIFVSKSTICCHKWALTPKELEWVKLGAAFKRWIKELTSKGIKLDAHSHRHEGNVKTGDAKTINKSTRQ